MSLTTSSSRIEYYYICHRCCAYKARYKKDISKHFSKKYPCSSNYQTIYSTYSSNDLEALSVSKRFFFHVNPESLSLQDYVDIIINYKNDVNYIYDNFRYISAEDRTKALFIKNTDIPGPQTNFEKTSPTINLLPKGEQMLKHSDMMDGKNIEEDNTEYEDDDDKEEKKQKKHVCPNCGSTFSKKGKLVNHLEQTEKKIKHCERMKWYNQSMKNVSHEVTHETVGSAQNGIYIHGHNNSVNIQNINHNQTTNMTKLDVKDFLRDTYNYSHIVPYELDSDFYILSKFLPLLMQNHENHNLFFFESQREACVFTSDTIRKMPADKAGFLILDKLKKTLSKLICDTVLDRESREKFEFMTKYYTKILNKYRCDTLYRDYDTETHTFKPVTHGECMRSRDEMLTIMIGAINRHEREIKSKIMENEEIEPRFIVNTNPCIEDFASSRVRYRDLKK